MKFNVYVARRRIRIGSVGAKQGGLVDLDRYRGANDAWALQNITLLPPI